MLILRKNKDKNNVDKIQEINLFAIKTVNYEIQKHGDIFYMRNKKTGYIDQVNELYIKIK